MAAKFKIEKGAEVLFTQNRLYCWMGNFRSRLFFSTFVLGQIHFVITTKRIFLSLDLFFVALSFFLLVSDQATYQV